MKKKSKLSLIALILGVIAVIIEIGSAGDAFGSTTNSAEEIGTAIGMAFVMPSVVCMFVAVILNAIGYFLINRVLTLISAIFYAIALVLMPLWGFLGIPSMILQFIAFAKMKSNKKTKTK